jgi:hypothetical protein
MSIEERWIPTTTCMWPKEPDKTYLITIHNRFENKDRVVPVYFIIDEYTNKKYWVDDYGTEQEYYYDPSEVTAWMSLPKPYKKGA